MARISADGQEYTRALTLGTQAALSVCMWFKLSVDRNDYSSIFFIDNGTSDNWGMQTGADGTTMSTVFDASTQQGMGSLTVGTWYFVCLATNGTTGTLYHKTAGASALTSVSVTSVSASVNAATLRLGESPWGAEWWHGCINATKVYTAQLTAADALQESMQYVPVRTANQVAFYPLVRPETTDYSGNGRTLSGGVGATREDGPPIPWASVRPRVFLPAAVSGGTVTGTVAATFGGLAATASGTRTVTATAAAALGGLNATATGIPTAAGGATAPLGALTAAATGLVIVAATAAAPLGALAATAVGARTATGSAAAVLGALTAAATGATGAAGTATAPFGLLAATMAGLVTATGTATAALGPLTAAATGVRFTGGAASATLGVLVATAAGTVIGSGSGSAAAVLGALAASAIGTVSVAATGAALFGSLTAVAAGTRATDGTAAAVLGALVAAASGQAESSTAAAAFGELDAAASGLRLVSAAAASLLGGLTAAAVGATFTAGTAIALLGALTASVTVTPPTTRGGSDLLERTEPGARSTTRTTAAANLLPRTGSSARGGT